MQIGIMPRPINPASTWLLKHRANIASQGGEDGIISKVFEVMGRPGRVCVEFGAWDGVRFSNTFALITRRDWSGYLIEANADKFQALQETYRDNPRATLVHRFVKLNSGEGTLDEILTEHGCPAEVDLLSIDIDGNDYHIWEGLTRHSAAVVVIEFNPTIPNDVFFVQDRSFDVNQGCSLLSLTILGRKKGYELVCVTGWNAIFVRREFFGLFGIKDNSPDAMYQPLMDGRIFHGYDGTIHVTGMPRLMWHGVTVSSDNFQVLPPERRVFDDAQR